MSTTYCSFFIVAGFIGSTKELGSLVLIFKQRSDLPPNVEHGIKRDCTGATEVNAWGLDARSPFYHEMVAHWFPSRDSREIFSLQPWASVWGAKEQICGGTERLH